MTDVIPVKTGIQVTIKDKTGFPINTIRVFGNDNSC